MARLCIAILTLLLGSALIPARAQDSFDGGRLSLERIGEVKPGAYLAGDSVHFALVSDGAIRDSPEIARQPFPVFVAGQSANLSLVAHHAVDIDVPIACAGVPVFPRDILVGDEEGVVVVPRHLAAEIAAPAAEQEELERFILERVEGGAPLAGTYPPDERTLQAYAARRVADNDDA